MDWLIQTEFPHSNSLTTDTFSLHVLVPCIDVHIWESRFKPFESTLSPLRRCQGSCRPICYFYIADCLCYWFLKQKLGLVSALFSTNPPKRNGVRRIKNTAYHDDKTKWATSIWWIQCSCYVKITCSNSHGVSLSWVVVGNIIHILIFSSGNQNISIPSPIPIFTPTRFIVCKLVLHVNVAEILLIWH